MAEALRQDATPESLARERASLEDAIGEIEAELAASGHSLFGPALQESSDEPRGHSAPPRNEEARSARLVFALALVALAAAVGALALRPAVMSGARLAAARSPAAPIPSLHAGREIAVGAWRLGDVRGSARWVIGPDRFSLALAGTRTGFAASVDLSTAGAPPLEIRVSAAPDPALRATHAIEFAFEAAAPGNAMVALLETPRVKGPADDDATREPTEVAGVVIRTGPQTFTASFSNRPQDEAHNRALMRDMKMLVVVIRTDAGEALTLELELPGAVAAVFQSAKAPVRPYARAR